MPTRKKLLVRDYMSRQLTRLSPETEIMQAVHKLVSQDISGAPVVDDTGQLIGILTHKDCMAVVLNTAYHSDFCGVVADYMTTNPLALPPELDIVGAAQRFLEQKYHSYPVVDDGVLVGQISRRDILIALEDAWQWQSK